eukprot:GHVU01077209.1.p2 GENE.GHVU01077209.1~~GHVU01077209.1.p2  ORF type:complete len:114 (+),score=8.47 GHVU01077209.1:1280-1621(+)
MYFAPSLTQSTKHPPTHKFAPHGLPRSQAPPPPPPNTRLVCVHTYIHAGLVDNAGRLPSRTSLGPSVYVLTHPFAPLPSFDPRAPAVLSAAALLLPGAHTQFPPSSSFSSSCT